MAYDNTNMNVPVIENSVPIAPPLHGIYVEQIPQQEPLNDLSYICRVAISVLFIFLLAMIVPFIIWLVFHPNIPQLRVSSASISRLPLSKDAILAAECNVTLSITNTNQHISAIYERMEISLIYPSQSVRLAQFYSNPFLQPQKNSTRIETRFGFGDVFFGNDVAEAFKKDVDGGSLRLGVRVNGIISWKNRKFGMQSQIMIAYCRDLVFGFSGSAGEVGVFQSAGRDCQVYVY